MNKQGKWTDVRVVVLGGAGFLGSHLCERLIDEGATVTCIDNFRTGTPNNVAHLMGRGMRLIEYDIVDYLHVSESVEYVFNFASPASPIDFERFPIQILKTGALGTHNALGLALAKGATFVQASTSEVYGDPQVNPQPETYWGNVNPIGMRGVYDEGKRFGEALTMAYQRTHGLETRIARIFNTYGPRMRPDDGRAVPAFFKAALRNEPLPVHGSGEQTRSLCFVDDLIEGVLRLAESEENEPVNLGNQDEITIRQLAEAVIDVVGSESTIKFYPRPTDDPNVRRPDVTKAEERLGWSAKVPLREGLERTLPWFERALAF